MNYIYMSDVATNDLSAVWRYHETSYITMRFKSSRMPDDSSPARVLSRNILLLGMRAYATHVKLSEKLDRY